MRLSEQRQNSFWSFERDTRCRTQIGNKVRNYFCNRQRIAKEFYLFFSNTIVTPHSACRESHKSHKSSQRVPKKAKRPYIYCVCSYLSFSTTPLSFLYRGYGGKFSLSRFFFALLKRYVCAWTYLCEIVNYVKNIRFCAHPILIVVSNSEHP